MTGQPPDETSGEQRPKDQSLDHPDQRAPDDIPGTIALGIGQMGTAMLQTRIVADHATVGLIERLLGVEMGREGCRIGLLLPLAQSAQSEIEQTQHLGRITHLARLIRLVEFELQVHGIQ
jgi:hypothetical protein